MTTDRPHNRIHRPGLTNSQCNVGDVVYAPCGYYPDGSTKPWKRGVVVENTPPAWPLVRWDSDELETCTPSALYVATPPPIVTPATMLYIVVLAADLDWIAGVHNRETGEVLHVCRAVSESEAWELAKKWMATHQ